jgi:hypothetical protein
MVEATTAALTARAKELDQKRRATEQRLQDIVAELDSMPGAPGLTEKLVDDEVRFALFIPDHQSTGASADCQCLERICLPIGCPHTSFSPV